jgi:hypothetical protein
VAAAADTQCSFSLDEWINTQSIHLLAPNSTAKLGTHVRTFTSEKDSIVLHDDAGPCEISPWLHTAGTDEGDSCMHNTHTHPPKLCVSGLVSHLTANSTAAGFKKKVRELTLTFHAARALVGAPALLCRLVRGGGGGGVDLRRVYVYKC